MVSTLCRPPLGAGVRGAAGSSSCALTAWVSPPPPTSLCALPAVGGH